MGISNFQIRIHPKLTQINSIPNKSNQIVFQKTSVGLQDHTCQSFLVLLLNIYSSSLNVLKHTLSQWICNKFCFVVHIIIIFLERLLSFCSQLYQTSDWALSWFELTEYFVDKSQKLNKTWDLCNINVGRNTLTLNLFQKATWHEF